MKKLFLCSFAFLILISCAPKNDTYNFEKIIFHSSRCFGSCPIINLQVNKDKSILLSRTKNETMSKIVTDINYNEFDYFKGTLSDKIYNQLISELVKTKDLKFDSQNCCDAPLKTMIIYQGGKRKEIETMFPPEEADNLISILYKISELENLTKVTEKFEIEIIEHHD